MVPIDTRKPKPTRADVGPGDTFQNLVEGWLVSNALALMNHRHLAKKVPLDSGNSRHVSRLVLWMDRVAAQEFIADDTTGHSEEVQRKHRLSLDKVRASNHRRAKRAIELWNPAKIEGRARGGCHGSKDRVRKGRTPRWTHGDLLPYWNLPPRKRRAATLAGTEMSSSRFDQLKRDMDAFVAGLREREQVQAELERDLCSLLDPD